MHERAEFTSAGPKNYGYKTHHGKVCCKVRGFSLNVRGSRQLNYDVMREKLLDEMTQPLDERRNIDVINPTSFGEIPPPNISKSSHIPNATDSSSTNVSLTQTLYCHFHTDTPWTHSKNCNTRNFFVKNKTLETLLPILPYLAYRKCDVTSFGPMRHLGYANLPVWPSDWSRVLSRDFCHLSDWLPARLAPFTTRV